METKEYVIEVGGFNRYFSWCNPVAVVQANNEDEAQEMFLLEFPSYDETDIDNVSLIEDWANTGTHIEKDGENLPICIECIESDGGFMGGEEELSGDEYGPCWRCIEVCGNTTKYISK